MDGKSGVTLDPLLAPLLTAGADEVDAIIEALVTGMLASVIDPVLRGVVGQDPPDVMDDLRADVTLRLINRLRALPLDRSAEIVSFRDFAAMVTYHAYGDYMRRMFPRRARLKKRVRYVLNHDHRFAVSSRQSGLAVSLITSEAGPTSAPVAQVAEACVAALAGHREPMELELLVTAVAERLGEIDAPDLPLEARRELAGPADLVQRIENRDYLRHLWLEIRELPRRQRMALLLNLRDSDDGSVVRFLPLTGIASIGDIAVALELEPHLFAELWNGLPLDDAEIALRLGLTRQQVINLRKSARERLARRMARLDLKERR
jgi:hypothetical protein